MRILYQSDFKNSHKINRYNIIINLNKIQETRPNSFLIRLFFNAKADEILTIFSGGPKTDINAMVENLNRFSPQNSSKWALIQF